MRLPLHHLNHLHHLQLLAAPAFLFSACMLLAGCASAPPATQIIEVPVHVPCVKDLPAAPEYEFDRMQLDASSGEKVLALARDWPRGRRYEIDLLAVIAGCL